MNLAWKIVVFTICLNVAGGIMTNYLGIDTFDVDNTILDRTDIYNVNGNGTVIDTIPVTGEVNWADNLLGLIGLGFIVDILHFLTDYLFGITDILMAILPGDADLNYLTWMVNGLIALIYTFSLFSLFTGKNLNSED